MWIRKNDKDRSKGRGLPIPTQAISNEEFIPMPQTGDQRAVERRITELADIYAGKLGTDRRSFLGSAGGMAIAFMAMNDVFGDYFEVDVAEAAESAATKERWPKNELIFDAQLHHVKNTIPGPLAFRRIAGMFKLNPELVDVTPQKDDLHLANFTKEVFLDSDTVMGIISGAPLGGEKENILPAEMMVNTRETLNQLSGSRRMLSHGLAAPNMPGGLEHIEYQAKELKVDGWKCYTGVHVNAWRFDDEEIAYPFFELALKLGITNISVHKGLPIAGTNPEYCRPWDIKKAALDWPDLDFIVYHSGFKNMIHELPRGESGVADDGYLEWTTDIVDDRLETPKMTNVYMELGSTFGHTAITHPELCGQLMGQIINAFGADHVIWGTDSIWWGSPQWQIEAFRRFQIPESMQEKFGYPPISDEDKALIFGLNAAKLYGIDTVAARKAFPSDSFSKLKAEYLEEGADPSHTQYGWIFEGDNATASSLPWTAEV